MFFKISGRRWGERNKKRKRMGWVWWQEVEARGLGSLEPLGFAAAAVKMLREAWLGGTLEGTTNPWATSWTVLI